MKAVLVTTKYKGVFFGYLEGEINGPGKIELKNARNCLYWTSDCKGFIGLATTGPTSGCRIGPKASEITLYGVTSITPVTDAAVEKWESAPWN